MQKYVKDLLKVFERTLKIFTLKDITKIFIKSYQRSQQDLNKIFIL